MNIPPIKIAPLYIHVSGFHTGFFAGGEEVMVTVVVAGISMPTHANVNVYMQSRRSAWGYLDLLRLLLVG